MNSQPLSQSPYDPPAQTSQPYQQPQYEAVQPVIGDTQPQTTQYNTSQRPPITGQYEQHHGQQYSAVPQQPPDHSKEQYANQAQTQPYSNTKLGIVDRVYKGPNRKRNIIISAAVIGVVILIIALGAGLGAGLHSKKKTPKYSSGGSYSGSGSGGGSDDGGYSSDCTPPGSTSCVTNDDCSGFNSFCQFSCDGSAYCYT